MLKVLEYREAKFRSIYNRKKDVANLVFKIT